MIDSVRRVPIGDVVTEPSLWNPREAASAQLFQYIDISRVDSTEKRITGVAGIVPSEAPSRARQLVRSADVLVSTVRPNLNAVAIVPDELDGATASTGFAVLRPDPTKIEARYLYHWVRTAAFVRAMTARATGASYPAVTEHVVRESKLPLPPLEEQKRIVAVLDKADAIRRKRRESLRLLDEFLRSAFLEMFGDPVRNDRGWKCGWAGQAISKIEAGTSVNGEDKLQGSGDWAVLKISAVTSGWYLTTEYKVVEMPPERTIIPKAGDLLFSRANTRELVAATCLVDHDQPRLFLPDKLWRITPNLDVATAEYLRFLLANSRFRRTLTRRATGSSGSMLNVSQEKLLELALPLPPLDLQRWFAAVVWNVVRMRQCVLNAGHETMVLFDSLAQRAFAESSNG